MLRLMDEVVYYADDHCAHVLDYITWVMYDQLRCGGFRLEAMA